MNAKRWSHHRPTGDCCWLPPRGSPACSQRLPTAQAQDYPTRTVRIIVPFPAGGTADAMPRAVCRLPVAQVEAAGRDRESRRRRRQCRRGGRLQVGARRLHAVVGAAAAAGHQSQPLSQDGLRSAQVPADRGDGSGAERAADACELSAQLRRRSDRLCQGQSGQSDIGNAGQRHDLAPYLRNVRDAGRA